MADVQFTVTVTMSERWVDTFCSMLKYMEKCGNQGHTSTIAFCADGDGDFRPKFSIDKDFNLTQGVRIHGYFPSPEYLFDAG